MSDQNSESEKVAFWSMAIEEQCRSDLSIRAFCEREGLSPASFYLWRRNLAQQATEGMGNEASEFIEVAAVSPLVTSAAEPASEPIAFAPLELLLGDGVIIRVHRPLDVTLLRQVMEALA